LEKKNNQVTQKLLLNATDSSPYCTFLSLVQAVVLYLFIYYVFIRSCSISL